ncbi:type II toxin-antitoxin system Phd/YefM family antitoxin [Rickettsia endosymbiont of Pantilius tunicatus]|uniref:type II toxin-antitoxin system Phd/YefM family antitoxin n=1 Tax=unclassified Rickettsia TaxID=114295 RepID=UPI00376EF6CD
MKNISSREAQNHFGELMIQVIKEPIIINRYGKPAAVLISHEEYEKFSQFEDMYWTIQAKNAAKEGFLSEKESEDFLNKILKE